MTDRLTYLLIALASLLLTACSVFDDHMYGPNGERKVSVSFVLALGSSDAPLTKAETWDPEDPSDDNDGIGYDPKVIGSSYDNTIDPGTLQVVLYHNASGDFIGQVDDLTYHHAGETENDMNLYEFTGSLLMDEDLVDSQIICKMMVFANMPESQREIISGGVNVSGLEALMFTRFTVGDLRKDTEYIPMWGVKTVEMNFSEGPGTKDLGTIYALRAMAKVEVKVSEELAVDYTLTEMNICNLNASGYVLPGNALEQGATEDLQLAGCLNVLDSDQYVSPVVTSEGSSSLAMYIPEKDNHGFPSEISVTLKYNGGAAPQVICPESTIRFTEYKLGKPSEDDADIYDVIRNHNYIFEITGISPDGLRFIVSVKDLDLGGIYGFIYDQDMQ